MISRAALALALPFFLFGALPSAAQDTTQLRVALRGLSVGTLVIRESYGGNGVYDASSQFQTTGVAGLVRNVKFTMQSRGRHSGSQLDPAYFIENMNTGKRKSNNEVQFTDEDGRYDPNSAMIAALADRTLEQGCKLSVNVYDGKRTNRLRIDEAGRNGDTLNCSGSFMRARGYTQKQLSFRKGYNFTISYQRQGDRYVFREAQADTDYGLVTLSPQ
ncbi:DUF3108 domain-containing protein [Maritimibacter dapengensis]|uniref:DUF3108 domain-containing protein n=1 Tax=Maritimibacter dapengensis TaxID=2836868 RepID=A0ABS6T868_9RHOB|nr:DUF3108 domain-containing protein [Maritimibacter dapengensis]MBV7380747.1 DUF3108 domain-containing protein [Maritimibacter dapengensis]